MPYSLQRKHCPFRADPQRHFSTTDLDELFFDDDPEDDDFVLGSTGTKYFLQLLHKTATCGSLAVTINSQFGHAYPLAGAGGIPAVEAMLLLGLPAGLIGGGG